MIGDKLRIERVNEKKTLREVADDIGISFSALGKYERNETEPDFSTLVKLAEYYNVSTDYLLGVSIITNDDNSPKFETLLKQFSTDEKKYYEAIIHNMNYLVNRQEYANDLNKKCIPIFNNINKCLYVLDSSLCEDWRQKYNQEILKSDPDRAEEKVVYSFWKCKSGIESQLNKLLKIYLDYIKNNE